MTTGFEILASNSAQEPPTNWVQLTNIWVTEQGGWIGLASVVVIVGPFFLRFAPRLFPIPLKRRHRAWELLKRLGDLSQDGSSDLGRAARTFVLREEAYDAVRRKITAFLTVCLLFYPLLGFFIMFVASQVERSGTPAQLLVTGCIILVGAPIGVIISYVDARWNRRVLKVIDEILLKDKPDLDQLLVNPAAAITEQCETTRQKGLMSVDGKVIVGRMFDRLKPALEPRRGFQRFINRWKCNLAVREFIFRTRTLELVLRKASVKQRERRLNCRSKQMEEG